MIRKAIAVGIKENRRERNWKWSLRRKKNELGRVYLSEEEETSLVFVIAICSGVGTISWILVAL